jgi:hypothetical protein
VLFVPSTLEPTNSVQNVIDRQKVRWPHYSRILCHVLLQIFSVLRTAQGIQVKRTNTRPTRPLASEETLCLFHLNRYTSRLSLSTPLIPFKRKPHAPLRLSPTHDSPPHSPLTSDRTLRHP